jgi:PAS domain S-box-containing protein
MTSAKILIVEDEGIVAKDIQNRLTRQGYTVVGTTETGEDAVRMAGHLQPDLVLMDIRLKGAMDGVTAAEQIRDRCLLPVIYLTAYADDATLARARLTEPYGYILKPFEERELRTVIEMALFKHRAERRLRESERRFATTLHSIGEAVIATDSQGRVTFLNPVAEKLTGWSLAEAVGLALEDVFRLLNVQTRGVEDPTTRLLQTGASVNPARHTVLVARDGREVPIDDCAAPIHDEQGRCTGTVLVFRDISASLQMEEQLRQYQRMEAIGQLAGGVAHDFNNLLTVINGCSNLILAAMEPDHAWHRLVTEISQAGERAAGLTRQLLAFSRKQVLQPKVLDLNQIVAGMGPMLARLIGEHIEIRTELAPAPGLVWADPGQLEQVILNLAVNARDAMPNGGQLLFSTANVVLDEEQVLALPDLQPGPHERLTVTDTGCGMSPAVRKRAFEPFFTTKEEGRGTGLGLSTVYGIVKQSGGHIAVTSVVGRGTTFTVFLPSVRTAPSPDPAQALPAEMPRGTETILLVEDDEAVRTLARTILQMSGYTVLEARHGAEALARLAQYTGPLHLLATDVVMPQMSGRDLVNRLINQRPGLKVLFLSGYSDTTLIQKDLAGGSQDYLPKPYTPSALTRKIRELLDR